MVSVSPPPGARCPGLAFRRPRRPPRPARSAGTSTKAEALEHARRCGRRRSRDACCPPPRPPRRPARARRGARRHDQLRVGHAVARVRLGVAGRRVSRSASRPASRGLRRSACRSALHSSISVFGVALDRLELAALLGGDERDRAAALARAARAADAVHVDVGRVGDVVVHDVAHARDVEAAGRDVGGDEQPLAAGLEGDHHAVALALGHVAVQRLDAHAGVAQPARQPVDADLGAHEDDRLLGRSCLEHVTSASGFSRSRTST